MTTGDQDMSTALPGRYWLFMYADHYPSGGMEDFCGSFATLGDAQDHAHGNHNWGVLNNAHVVDTSTGTVEWEADDVGH